jgi:hypothetical protein
MSALTNRTDDPTEALILEQAQVFAQQLLRVSREAPDGQVLARVEQLVLAEGREFLRKAMAVSLEAEGPTVEKKGRPPGRVVVGSDAI